jgi:hypothetical protein
MQSPQKGDEKDDSAGCTGGAKGEILVNTLA